MDESEWEELSREFDEYRRKSRGYATYWEWMIQEVEELGVVEELCRSISATEGRDFEPPVPVANDPPDCEVRAKDGAFIGVEATELIDPKHISEFRRTGRDPAHVWDRGKLVSAIDARVRAKDIPSWANSPYDEYWLVLYTDDPNLGFGAAQSMLADYAAPDTSTITHVYFIFSYDPSRNGCPQLRLK